MLKIVVAFVFVSTIVTTAGQNCLRFDPYIYAASIESNIDAKEGRLDTLRTRMNYYTRNISRVENSISKIQLSIEGKASFRKSVKAKKWEIKALETEREELHQKLVPLQQKEAKIIESIKVLRKKLDSLCYE